MSGAAPAADWRRFAAATQMSDHKPAATGCELCGADRRVPLSGVEATVVRCAACGLVHRHPRPSDGELTEHYREAYYVEQERVGAARIVSARARVYRRTLEEWARRGVRGRLLDVGAGYGDFVRLAVDAGFDAIGVEISPAAAKAAKDQRGVRVIAGALSDELRAEGKFDVVTMWNVLDQVASPRAELARIHDLLVPGGLLAVRVPNVGFHLFARRAYARLEPLLARVGVADPTVFMTYSYSAATLHQLLGRAGFVAIGIRNASLTSGDPYRSLSLGEQGAALVKATMSALAGAVAAAHPHWLIAPSLYAEARTRTHSSELTPAAMLHAPS